MKIVVLTSSPTGTASECLPELAQSNSCQVLAVIVAQRRPLSTRGVARRKFNKILRIGPIGALNGVRIRKWFRGEPTPDIRELCRNFCIPVHQTETINCAATVRILESLQPELAVSLNNGYIAPKVFALPRYGTINAHGERLPEYQNAQSVIWPIYHNETCTGLTVHQVSREIDVGDILYRETFPIKFFPRLEHTVRATLDVTRMRTPPAVRFVCDHYLELRATAKPQRNGRKFTTPTFKQFVQMTRNNRRLYREQLASELAHGETEHEGPHASA